LIDEQDDWHTFPVHVYGVQSIEEPAAEVTVCAPSQLAPVCFAMHEPFVHAYPSVHSVSLLQELTHDPVPTSQT
jgi:hypothetical protein